MTEQCTIATIDCPESLVIGEPYTLRFAIRNDGEKEAASPMGICISSEGERTCQCRRLDAGESMGIARDIIMGEEDTEIVFLACGQTENRLILAIAPDLAETVGATIEFQEIVEGITPPRIPLLFPGFELIPLLPGWIVRDAAERVVNEGIRLPTLKDVIGDGTE